MLLTHSATSRVPASGRRRLCAAVVYQSEIPGDGFLELMDFVETLRSTEVIRQLNRIRILKNRRFSSVDPIADRIRFTGSTVYVQGV